jgi:hypothetical protein
VFSSVGLKVNLQILFAAQVLLLKTPADVFSLRFSDLDENFIPVQIWMKIYSGSDLDENLFWFRSG